MTSLIHPSSSISKSVKLGEDVKVGPFCNIDGNIIIGDGTELKSHVGALSIEIAEKIIQNELSKDEKQKALVDKILDKTNMN